MVCPRCITAVENVFNDLNLLIDKIELGTVKTKKSLSNGELKNLQDNLILLGFDLVDDSQSKLVVDVKSLIIEIIYGSTKPPKSTLSNHLEDKFNLSYSTISKSFSAQTGITIERYVILQKVESVKELLCYSDQTVKEIAYELSFNSVAHLSNQFKKETGMSPSAFRKMTNYKKRSLDSIG